MTEKLLTLIVQPHSQPSPAAASDAGAPAHPELSIGYAGWRVVLGAVLQGVAAFGAAWAFAAFSTPLGAELGSSTTGLGSIFGTQIALMMILAPLGGVLADRLGTRVTCLIGTALMMSGLLITAQTHSPATVHLAYGVLMGIGLALVFNASLAVVRRWFSQHRGLAAGIAASGIALGTMLGTPIAMGLIGWLGWRDSMNVFAIALALIGTCGALLLRDRGQGGPAAAAGPSVRETALSPRFLRMLVGNALGGFASLIPLGFLVPSAMAQGVDMALLPLLMTLIGVGSLLGRVLLGGIADRLGRVRTFAVLYLLQGAGYLVWLVASEIIAFGLFALMHGLAYRAVVAIRPAVVADLFRCRSMATLTGLVLFPVGVGAGFGATAMGWTFDVAGSYGPAILGIGLASFAAGLIVLPLARRRAA